MSMTKGRRALDLCLSTGAVALVAACGSDPAGPGGEVPRLVSVTVAPAFGRLVSAGDSLLFAASALYDDGSMRDIAPSWSSSDPDVAAIDPDGWAVARATGFVSVEARFEGQSATGALLIDSDTIAPDLVDVFVDRPWVNIFQRPGVIRLRAEFDDAGSGAASALAVFDGPFGAGITGVVTLEALPPDSASLPGDMTVTRTAFAGFLQIPANAGVGLWTLAELRVDDRSRNTAQWGVEALEELGLVVEVQAVLTGG
jgi:hypothetical protein